MAISVTGGVVLGEFAGLGHRVIDEGLSRVLDVLSAFSTVQLALPAPSLHSPCLGATFRRDSNLARGTFGVPG